MEEVTFELSYEEARKKLFQEKENHLPQSTLLLEKNKKNLSHINCYPVDKSQAKLM